MGMDADQMDAMIIEGEERIAEFESQLRELGPHTDPVRSMHILLLLYRGVNRLYAERLASLLDDYGTADRREGDGLFLLH